MDNKVEFKWLEALAENMMDLVDSECIVSAVSGNRQLILDLFDYMYHEYDLQIMMVDYDEFEYDKEYMVSVDDDGTIFLEKAFNYQNGKYYFTDGFSFVDKDVNEQYITDNADKGDEVCFVRFSVDDYDDSDDLSKEGSLCMDDDGFGFCYCCESDHGRQKLSYRGCDKITKDEAWRIVRENM